MFFKETQISNHLLTVQKESNFDKRIFVVNGQNLAFIREDCLINLLNEVKKAPMVYTLKQC